MKTLAQSMIIAGTLTAVPAVAQSYQAQEMLYRAEAARERSHQHFQEVQQRAYLRQQAEHVRQAELRARSRRR